MSVVQHLNIPIVVVIPTMEAVVVPKSCQYLLRPETIYVVTKQEAVAGITQHTTTIQEALHRHHRMTDLLPIATVIPLLTHPVAAKATPREEAVVIHQVEEEAIPVEDPAEVVVVDNRTIINEISIILT